MTSIVVPTRGRPGLGVLLRALAVAPDAEVLVFSHPRLSNQEISGVRAAVALLRDSAEAA